MNIFVISHGTCYNKGDAALVDSMTSTLQAVFPNSEFSITSSTPEFDRYKISTEVIERPLLSNDRGILPSILSVLPTFLLIILAKIIGKRILMSNKKNCYLRKCAEADIIVSRANDILTDYYGLLGLIANCYEIWLSSMINKNVAIYAHSVGPFRKGIKGWFAKQIVKLTLSNLALITVRDPKSRETLNTLSAKKTHIFQTADPAFLLKPSDKTRSDKILKCEFCSAINKPVVGIAISSLIYKYLPGSTSSEEKLDNYVDIVSSFCDYIIKRTRGTIILVPHVIGPRKSQDDRRIGKKILKKLNSACIKNVHLLVGDYKPSEIKSVIGNCDFFVGMRMHPTIHSCSMCVPTIAVDYLEKATGMMRLFDLENYVLDIRFLNKDTLFAKFDELVNNSDTICDQMTRKISSIKQLSLLNARLLKEHLR